MKEQGKAHRATQPVQYWARLGWGLGHLHQPGPRMDHSLGPRDWLAKEEGDTTLGKSTPFWFEGPGSYQVLPRAGFHWRAPGTRLWLLGLAQGGAVAGHAGARPRVAAAGMRGQP